MTKIWMHRKAPNYDMAHMYCGEVQINGEHVIDNIPRGNLHRKAHRVTNRYASSGYSLSRVTRVLALRTVKKDEF